ncbi:hypothetical protein DLAC_08654 [Tieghemostelium lacteum]|uniref:CID domain-containing protein n=1 Tax=Tieghemostelium lacteum TaxID=361077 RepID=A0A151Z7Y8_TIELA|nr:hypothetical protein DLAC_08654 [Tieghemostelium lacteum]|eukprot:KYQ90070.1 hypothetical protein DLAC_08654 [Tieghemostelium lacteum]
MEVFSQISSYDSYPTEPFKELLECLSKSKESIDKAAKYAMGNLEYLDDLFDILLNRMRKSAMNKRLSFFYLIDSICQNCFLGKNKDYVNFISKHIEEIILLTLPDDNIELLKKNKESIEKVLTNWTHRDIFQSTIISKARTVITSDLQRHHSRSICPDLSEIGMAKLLKTLDEDRREIKKKKYEFSPENRHPLEEFIEIWYQCCAKNHSNNNSYNNNNNFEQQQTNSTKTSPSLSPVQMSTEHSEMIDSCSKIEPLDYKVYNHFKKEFILPQWWDYQIYSDMDLFDPFYDYTQYPYNNNYQQDMTMYQNNNNNFIDGDGDYNMMCNPEYQQNQLQQQQFQQFQPLQFYNDTNDQTIYSPRNTSELEQLEFYLKQIKKIK